MKLTPKSFMKTLVRTKKCLILVTIQLSQNFIMNQKISYLQNHILQISKMKDETGGVAIKEFVELKPKMY